jgi:hypothetical protein
MPVINSHLKTLVFGKALQILVLNEEDLKYEEIGKLLRKGVKELVLGPFLSVSLDTGEIVLRGYKISETAYIVTGVSEEKISISFLELGVKKAKALETIEYLYHLAVTV